MVDTPLEAEVEEEEDDIDEVRLGNYLSKEVEIDDTHEIEEGEVENQDLDQYPPPLGDDAENVARMGYRWEPTMQQP